MQTGKRLIQMGVGNKVTYQSARDESSSEDEDDSDDFTQAAEDAQKLRKAAKEAAAAKKEWRRNLPPRITRRMSRGTSAQHRNTTCPKPTIKKTGKTAGKKTNKATKKRARSPTPAPVRSPTPAPTEPLVSDNTTSYSVQHMASGHTKPAGSAEDIIMALAKSADTPKPTLKELCTALVKGVNDKKSAGKGMESVAQMYGSMGADNVRDDRLVDELSFEDEENNNDDNDDAGGAGPSYKSTYKNQDHPGAHNVHDWKESGACFVWCLVWQ